MSVREVYPSFISRPSRAILRTVLYRLVIVVTIVSLMLVVIARRPSLTTWSTTLYVYQSVMCRVAVIHKIGVNDEFFFFFSYDSFYFI